MKENKLKMACNNDETLVSDESGELLETLQKNKDLHFSYIFLKEGLQKGNLTEGMKESCLLMLENQVVNILNSFDYASVLAKEKKERCFEIANLNKQNRMLREKIGKQTDNDDLRERLKLIMKSFKDFWRNKGFGHCRETSFTDYGFLQAILSTIHCPNKDYLNSIGFELFNNEVVANENSLKVLEKILKEQFPSIEINEITTNYYARRALLSP